MSARTRAADGLRLAAHAARLVGGRRYWIAPLLPLLWLAFHVLRVRFAPDAETPTGADAQGFLLGVPLIVLATGLGARVIAGEIDQRTLEIAFTVPGGAHRVWLAKLAAAAALLAAALAPLALGTWLFLTAFPAGALYGAYQAALFYLVTAMGLAALLKSEASGALGVAAVGLLNFMAQAGNLRVSPLFNPARLVHEDPREVLAWTVQNRIGVALAILAIALLSFGRAERRESMLGG